MITIASIQRAVADHYGIPFIKMREPFPQGRGRVFLNTRDAAQARQTAMALSVLLTQHGYSRIGHYFGGRDPSTVRHAAAEVAKRRRSDPNLHNAMRRITLGLVR